MDNMLEHPWTELQLLIKEKWLTQKAFSSILWKKVSEVNELLKWKRNITIQRDYLLHQTLWTPIKYWILKQIDYDYSLLDIEETDDLSSWALAKDLRWKTEELDTQDSSVASLPQNDTLSSSWAIAKDLRWEVNKSSTQDSSSPHSSEWQTKPQETPVQEQENKDNEDFKNRARIFKTF